MHWRSGLQRLGGSTSQPAMRDTQRNSGGSNRQFFIPIDVRELAAAIFVSIIVTLPIALVSAAACVWFAFFE